MATITSKHVVFDDLGGDDGLENPPSPGGVGIISQRVGRVFPIQNLNVVATTAGAQAVSPTAQAAHASPTLVQAKTKSGNHWFFILLVLAFFYFENKKGNL